MKQYIAKRVAHSAFVIFFVATIVFLAVRAIPGSPARLMLGGEAPQSAVIELRQELGLNEPVYSQYLLWMKDILTGNFGHSIFTDQAVLTMLIDVAVPTASIGILGMAIAFLIALPAGIVSATRRYQAEDYIATLVSFIGLSVPSFFLGIVFILIFSDYVGILPAFGYVPPSEGLIAWFKHIILPAIAVGIPYGGIIMRMTRSSMLEVLNEDYMRAARAKGLSPRLILYKHGLQNALIPVVTIAGILFAVLLGGVVSVEIVFGIQGLGRLLINSIQRRDFPVIQGGVVLISIIFVLMNLFVDIVYTMINPKIKYGGGG